jgi:hypothetical protein
VSVVGAFVVTDAASEEWPTFDASKYREAVSRNQMAALIVLNPNHPIVRMTFPNAGGDGFEFGEDILQKARAL